MVLTLHDDSVGDAAAADHSARCIELVGDMHRHGISGFCTRQWMISDHDLCVAYLSRAAWDAGATPEAPSTRTRSVRSAARPPSEPMLEAFRELEARHHAPWKTTAWG